MSTKTLLKNEQNQKEKNQKYNRRFKLMMIFLPIGLFLSVILAVALGPVTIHPLIVWKIALSHMPFLDNLIQNDWTNAQENIVWGGTLSTCVIRCPRRCRVIPCRNRYSSNSQKLIS